jgi:hypothetical protein
VRDREGTCVCARASERVSEKETYVYGKRDLRIWQTRPNMANETPVERERVCFIERERDRERERALWETMSIKRSPGHGSMKVDSLDGIEEIHMHVGMYMHTHMHSINSH